MVGTDVFVMENASSDHILGCPAPYTAVRNRCLHAGSAKRNFDTAERYCSDHSGGYLASVHSLEENDGIRAEL